jgi:hypothetical protein
MSTQAAVKMPQYQCHKLVHALQIKSAFRYPSNPGDESGSVTLNFCDQRYSPMDLSIDLVARYWPKEGDYLVVYHDGYKSISPKQAFEEGYTPYGPLPEPGDNSCSTPKET